MSEAEMTKPMPEATQDARALLARLYREIGISAVTEALQLRDLPEPESRTRPSAAQATPRSDDLAA
jgi:hypothetical protein